MEIIVASSTSSTLLDDPYGQFGVVIISIVLKVKEFKDFAFSIEAQRLTKPTLKPTIIP